jgi:hypothetical protein
LYSAGNKNKKKLIFYKRKGFLVGIVGQGLEVGVRLGYTHYKKIHDTLHNHRPRESQKCDKNRESQKCDEKLGITKM